MKTEPESVRDARRVAADALRQSGDERGARALEKLMRTPKRKASRRWLVVRPALEGFRLHTRWLTREGHTTHERSEAGLFTLREARMRADAASGWEVQRVSARGQP